MSQIEKIKKNQELPDTPQEYEDDGSKFAPYDSELTLEQLALIEKYGIDEGDDLCDHLTEEERDALANKYASL